MCYFSQEWSRNYASDKKLIISQLYEKLLEMEQIMFDELTEENLTLMDNTKKDLHDLEQENTAGILSAPELGGTWKPSAIQHTFMP